MDPNAFDSLAPELILLLSSFLPIRSLNALTATCHRLHETLQPELEARLTPALAMDVLLSAAKSSPHTVAKLLGPPHLVNPSKYGLDCLTPLHVAARAGNIETATLLLAASADPNLSYDQDEVMPLHYAVKKKDLAMTTLLLEHGAKVDECWGADGASTNALQFACQSGNLEMMKLLLAHGANPERRGHYGTALGFAVHGSKVEMVKTLLDAGADVTVTSPLFVLLVGGPPPPHSADLLYLAMRLLSPGSRERLGEFLKRAGRPAIPDTKWKGVPLSESKKEIMALLLAHGVSKEPTIALVSRYLVPLAREAKLEPEEYLEVIHAMMREAEDAIPEVLAKYSQQ
ncbi:ankyrin repeat-containing domain protein [Mycena filopes]|nr:ankyrin repeat-containing domain protein [Mycena filopes]